MSKVRGYILKAAVIPVLLPQLAIAGTSWYGQLNRDMVHVNDGFQKDIYFLDNDASGSRAGITGDMELAPGYTVGGKFELSVLSNDGSSASQLNATPNDSIGIRHADTWIITDLGTVSLGKGSMATDNTAEVTFAGVDNVSYSGAPGNLGGMYFHEKGATTQVTTASPRISQYFNNYDGLGRRDRLRYDSPMFGGAKLSMSIARVNTQYATDIALTYDNDNHDCLRVGGALGYYRLSKNTNFRAEKVVDGSLAVLHKPTGLNAAVSFARRDRVNANDKRHRYGYVQVGKMMELNSLGNTNLAVDYFKSKHSVANDDSARSVGLGVSQHLDNINSEVYAGVRQYKLKSGATNYDNVYAAILGFKFKMGGPLSD